ncbi:MAG: VanW family protein [Patescibacteria group bacterium]|jgi:vancomycin resistance protein YoaR
MSKNAKNKKPGLGIPKPRFRGIIIFLLAIFVLGGAVIGFVFYFDAHYNDKIYPGTAVGSLDIGGLSYNQAQEAIQSKMNEIIDQGLPFKYGDESFVIHSTAGDVVNPELSSKIISFNIDKTINTLKTEQARMNEAEHIYNWLAGYQTSVAVEIDQDKLTEALAAEVSSYEQPAVNSRLIINEDYSLETSQEKSGQAFNYNKIYQEAGRQLERLSVAPVILRLQEDNPKITRASAETVLPLVRQVLETAPFTAVYDDYAWLIDKEQVRQWLELEIDNGKLTVGLADSSLTPYLEEMAGIINIEKKEGKFSMENGKVTEFQPSQKGRELDIRASRENINEKIRQVGITEIDLAVKETEPELSTEKVNNLGINELIGEGRSNFAGSPTNRRHNITVGANTLNGILIAPDEEFSLVKTLGKIEASTGYLPELVIKGNKTTPEYGGGLCQIGTTTFRAAVNAGLPITARTNHSYRVSYYEPAGTDATIYDPKPDMKFINDTGHHILFTTEISGNDLIFRFYGTADGRKVEVTDPRVYNLVKPGPSKLVETTDLAPGVKKCTEKAHTGADAEFSRTVTYADGEKKSDTFKSHYKPWQEVCLIGVEKLSEPVSD